MKILISSFVLLLSASSFAQSNYLYECHATAIKAALAIDNLNFSEPRIDQTIITNDRSQRQNSAKIEVALGAGRNRIYLIKINKNRSAELRGQNISEDPGCFVESVSVK